MASLNFVTAHPAVPVTHSQAQKDALAPYGLPIADTSFSGVLGEQNPGLSEQTLAGLDRLAHVTNYREGTLISVEGQIPRGVFLICQGRVKLTSTNRDGKTLILRIMEVGEIVGLQEVMTNRAHEVSVETLQPSQFAFISRTDFLPFLRQHGDLCLHITQQLSRDCQCAYQLIRSIGLSHSVAEKLARLLLQWAAEAETSADAIRIKLALTHEDIAELIGTTRETVTRILAEFKQRNVLETKGTTLMIRDRTALERLLQA